MYSAYVLVLTVFHEVAELFVPDPAIGAAVEVHHSLDLFPSEVRHAATANHQSTDKLYACMQKRVEYVCYENRYSDQMCGQAYDKSIITLYITGFQ